MSAAIAPAPASAGSGGTTPAAGEGSSNQVAEGEGASRQPGAGTENSVPGARAGESEQQTIKRLERVEKINGKEVKLSATEDELWSAKRRESAVQDQARTMAAERKKLAAERQEWEAQQKRIAEDPFHHFRKDAGFNELEFLEKRMHGLLQDQNRDPRDLALSQKDHEVRRLQQELKDRDSKAKEAQELEAENQELRRDGALFAAALKKSGLPNDDLALDMIAKAYYTQQEETGLDLTADELATESRRMLTGALDNCADKMDDDAILEAFPKVAKKIHRALLAKYKRMQDGGQQRTQEPPQPIPPAGAQQQQERRQTEREQFAEMEKRSGRKLLRGL